AQKAQLPNRTRLPPAATSCSAHGPQQVVFSEKARSYRLLRSLLPAGRLPWQLPQPLPRQFPQLAVRAEVSRSSCLHDPLDFPPTAATFFALTIIDREALPIARVGVAARAPLARIEHEPDRVDELREFFFRHRGGGRARIDLGFPQCFGSVDVAETGKNRLVHQRGLDRDLSSLQDLREIGGIERRITCLLAQLGQRRAALFIESDRRQGASIDQGDARAVVE